MLDMLCDGVEAENHKEDRKKKIEEMNKVMDRRLNILKMRKQEQKEQKIEQDIQKNAIDSNSKLLVRKGTRVFTEDEIKAAAGPRQFIDVMSMDMFEVRTKQAKLSQTQGFFTIGVITDISPKITGKNGKPFCIIKVSDLIKYDLNKVKEQLHNHLALQIKNNVCDKDEIQMALKAFTPNGYKAVSIMCFGESS